MQPKLIVAFALLALACYCSSMKRLEIKPIRQKVVFHHAYMNDAWGYQNRGWYIDNEGVVKAYSRDSTEAWYRVERTGPDSGYIAPEALLTNYGFAERVIYKVPLLELRRNFDLIPAISMGELSPRVHVDIGHGLSQNKSFLWDPERGKFREVLISLSGDWEQINLSPSVERLDDWLNGINRIYYDSLAVKPRQDDDMPREIRER